VPRGVGWDQDRGVVKAKKDWRKGRERSRGTGSRVLNQKGERQTHMGVGVVL